MRIDPHISFIQHDLSTILLICLSIFVWLALEQGAAAQTSFDCATVSEIPRVECEALVAIYENNGGIAGQKQQKQTGCKPQRLAHGQA